MSDCYKHPSGYTIFCQSDGSIERIESPTGEFTYITEGEADTFRDYLLTKMGLWRDEETGAFVVPCSWTGAGATVIDGAQVRVGWAIVNGEPDRYDEIVARWRATLAPPSREPKPGEVWRVTRADGTTHNAVVLKPLSFGLSPRFSSPDGAWPVDAYPADRRRLLVEADGTVVAGDE